MALPRGVRLGERPRDQIPAPLTSLHKNPVCRTAPPLSMAPLEESLPSTPPPAKNCPQVSYSTSSQPLQKREQLSKHTYTISLGNESTPPESSESLRCYLVPVPLHFCTSASITCTLTHDVASADTSSASSPFIQILSSLQRKFRSSL